MLKITQGPMIPTHAHIDGRLHKIVRVDDHKNGRDGHIKVHLGCALTFDTERSKLDEPHWKSGDNLKADCAICADVEAGKIPPKEQELGHNMHTTVMADIPTGFSCEQCGTQVYMRRKDGKAVCCGGGHEYEPIDVVAAGMRVMHRLATGSFDKKDQ